VGAGVICRGLAILTVPSFTSHFRSNLLNMRTAHSGGEDHDARDSDSLLSHSKEVEDLEFHPKAKRRPFLVVISLLASHIFVALAGGWISTRLLVDLDDLCARYTTHYCKNPLEANYLIAI
jgi:hypothetical protein